jgi:methylenetetrahydrofolate--tRNA-(uracil-5-)-methyltransferase
MTDPIIVVGAGLAGCEAAWQLAERGFDVLLVEQKPISRTPAQFTDQFCELVCSNSMRGAALTNAVGLLKEELRHARLARHRLRRRDARAGRRRAGRRSRDSFSALVTRRVRSHPRISVEARVVESIPAAGRRAHQSFWPPGRSRAMRWRLGRGARSRTDAPGLLRRHRTDS